MPIGFIMLSLRRYLRRLIYDLLKTIKTFICLLSLNTDGHISQYRQTVSRLLPREVGRDYGLPQATILRLPSLYSHSSKFSSILYDYAYMLRVTLTFHQLVSNFSISIVSSINKKLCCSEAATKLLRHYNYSYTRNALCNFIN